MNQSTHLTSSSKFGVFGQKAVSGMNGLCSCQQRSFQNAVCEQIRLTSRRRTKQHSLVSLFCKNKKSFFFFSFSFFLKQKFFFFCKPFARVGFLRQPRKRRQRCEFRDVWQCVAHDRRFLLCWPPEFCQTDERSKRDVLPQCCEQKPSLAATRNGKWKQTGK